MKYVAAVFFILNGAAFLWLRALPDDSEVLRALLYQEASGPAREATGEAAAPAMQIEAGRGYERLFARHKKAGTLSGGLLLVNAAVFLSAAILLAQRSAEHSRTEPDSSEGTTASHAGR